MTDMTSREIHDAIDRALKSVAARFQKPAFSEAPAPQVAEVAEQSRAFQSDLKNS